MLAHKFKNKKITYNKKTFNLIFYKILKKYLYNKYLDGTVIKSVPTLSIHCNTTFNYLST